jgi:hypothetical protein
MVMDMAITGIKGIRNFSAIITGTTTAGANSKRKDIDECL